MRGRKRLRKKKVEAVLSRDEIAVARRYSKYSLKPLSWLYKLYYKRIDRFSDDLVVIDRILDEADRTFKNSREWSGLPLIPFDEIDTCPEQDDIHPGIIQRHIFT